MKAIVVSDLHIGTRFSLQQNFEHFLNSIPEDYKIILNGDIIESPCKKLPQAGQIILVRIEQISQRQQIVWVRGNHDNGYIPKTLGKIQFKQSHAFGKKLFITHGDYFDEVLPRSGAFIRTFKLVHDLRIKMGARPVHIAEYAKKWQWFYKILLNNVMINAVNHSRLNGFESVTWGHTHYPEDRIVDGIRYINTGAWTEFPGFYLLVSEDELTLKKAGDSFEPPKSSNLAKSFDHQKPEYSICRSEFTETYKNPSIICK